MLQDKLLESAVKVELAKERIADYAKAKLEEQTGLAATEYALVLLAGALIGVLVIGWATAGGGAAAIGALFNRVIDAVMDQL